MKSPELIENLGRIRKKDKSHDYGKFQCPFCSNTFVSQISKVVNEHTTSCGCRKKKNFTQALERQVKGKLTSSALAAFLDERASGAKQNYLCKKYGIKRSQYGTALRLALEQIKPLPQRKTLTSITQVVEQVSGCAPLVAPAAPAIINNYYGETTVNNDSFRRQIEKPPTPFEETEAYFELVQRYYNQHQTMPPEGWDARQWATGN